MGREGAMRIGMPARCLSIPSASFIAEAAPHLAHKPEPIDMPSLTAALQRTVKPLLNL